MLQQKFVVKYYFFKLQRQRVFVSEVRICSEVFKMNPMNNLLEEQRKINEVNHEQFGSVLKKNFWTPLPLLLIVYMITYFLAKLLFFYFRVRLGYDNYWAESCSGQDRLGGRAPWLGDRALRPHYQLNPCVTYKIGRGRGGPKIVLQEITNNLILQRVL